MIETPVLMMITGFLPLPPRKRSRKCLHVQLQQIHNHRYDKEKSEGNCRERKANLLAMHSLQRTEDELRFEESLAVGDEAHVGCNVVITYCLGVESSHGGCAVANEDAVPVAIRVSWFAHPA